MMHLPFPHPEPDTPRGLHDLAMELCDQARGARNLGYSALALQFYAWACKYESRAARILDEVEDNEPTRTILYRSAVYLAINAEDFEQAEALIEAAGMDRSLWDDELGSRSTTNVEGV